MDPNDGLTPVPSEQWQRLTTERHQALLRFKTLNKLQKMLSTSGGLDQKLQTLTNGLAETFHLDFCRIWLTKPGDLCDSGCVHAEFAEGPHACTDHSQCLHLMASSGQYARHDSKMHQRVPFGCYKIGRVGAGQERKFLTNDLAHDRRVPNPKWAAQLGLVSFAGYRLSGPAREPIGVLAFFAKRAISPEEDAMMESISFSISDAIQTASAQASLRESERKFRTLFEASNDSVVLFGNGVFLDCNEAALQAFGYEDCEELRGKRIEDLSPVVQPDGRNSTMLIEEETNRAWRDGLDRFECTFRRKDGSVFPAEVVLTQMEMGGSQILQVVVRDITERKEAEQERDRLIEELREALAKIKTLNGLLPICASCKKIRDDEGYWNQIESYVASHSNAQFSHGICPDCLEKLYPEFVAKKKREQESELPEE